MRILLANLLVVSALTVPALARRPSGHPFVGRWDFNITTPHGTHACWLGITEKDGTLDVWYQPPGGNVYQLKEPTLVESHLILTVAPPRGQHPATTWNLELRDGKLVGVQQSGPNTVELTGYRAPELKRREPKSWTAPEPLFDGKDLDGWEPIGDTAHNNWSVQDGLLVNAAHGANLRTTRKFEDFKVHYEVNCPEDGNSGFYLRGRYEVQIEYEPLSSNPPERRIGSIYGRIAPNPTVPRTPGQWETFDVMLVGRIVTVIHNGVTTIDHKEIDGITGGALDADEGEPGPFYIQGDHTGGLKFRNITVSVPER
ncbi:MAG TPA: DUF1080 domain-containing protein [Bryobacteraceae bacterium]|nr:DUF1080 domain-containing protein [Bryobacteraceae bacterium]